MKRYLGEKELNCKKMTNQIEIDTIRKKYKDIRK